MPSIHKKVCQCLAMFIRWADKILLNGGALLNKGEAHEVIKALTDGVEVKSYVLCTFIIFWSLLIYMTDRPHVIISYMRTP